MLRLIIGAFVAAFLMFNLGFVFWASGLIDFSSHMSPEAETAVADTLKANTTRHGLYFVPDIKNGTEAEVSARMSQGPFAMIYVKPDGAAMGAPSTLAMGFGHMFVTALLIGMLLKWVLPSTPGWMDRFKVAAMVGVIGTFFGQLAMPIWWHHDWSTALLFAAYNLVAYLIAGAVMAYAVRA